MTLSNQVIEDTLEAGLSQGANFSEIFFENSYESQLGLSSREISNGLVARSQGVGIRLFFGNRVFYTYTNNLVDLPQRVIQTSKAFKAAQRFQLKKLVPVQHEAFQAINTMPWEMEKSKKVKLLKKLDQGAREVHSQVSQVQARLTEVYRDIMIANSEGLMVTDRRAYSNLACEVIVENQGDLESMSGRFAKMSSCEIYDEVNFPALGRETAESALKMLTATAAPAGPMPVVISNGFGGVIFHEACGHGLETAAVANDASVFCGLLNKRVADPCVTAVDDGTIPYERGSILVDDEGQPTERTTLIEKGILKSYIVDKVGAIKTGYARTGSGRRQDYRFAPTSRMRNTFIAPGESSFEELIADIEHGIFAKQMGGGSVSPGTGDYNFAVKEAYRIHNGQIKEPLRGACLIGNGLDTLSKIKKVGSDFALAPGTCGAASGWVPTTVGQPSIFVSEILVGGGKL